MSAAHCCDHRPAQTLVIRRYHAEDHDAVWALHNLALNAVNAHGGNGPWDDDLHHVETVYLENRGEFLVGELNGRIVAMGALRRCDAESAEIKRMRVLPDCQRQGYGQAILNALEARARALGYVRLQLDTTAGQHAAQAFYAKNGYRETHRGQWKRFKVLFFEKSLGPMDDTVPRG